jgi:ATP-dependent helicase/nuclease subunit B
VSHSLPKDSSPGAIASLLLQQYSDQLPDLSGLVVLLSGADAAHQFDLDLGHALADNQAIVPPWTGTLSGWVEQFILPEHPDYPIINEYARQCLFVDALQDYPGLFKEQNQWQVTQSLLSLFDELSLSQCTIMSDQHRFEQTLQQAYTASSVGNDPVSLEHMNMESKLVYTLWHAWQKQLELNQCYDATSAYVSRLANWQKSIDASTQFIVTDDSRYHPVEKSFIDQMTRLGRCRIINSAAEMPDSVQNRQRTEFLQQCFAGDEEDSFNERALKLRSTLEAECQPPFGVYLADDDEDQIRAIDIYIRKRILSGDSQLAIISEDRKLSRRLRAVLERSGIELKDQAGWSLATTQAATIIERWLECIEDDFNALPLLDVLKSPFFFPAIDGGQFTEASRPELMNNVYRLENDIILHENISSNLKRYQLAMQDRLKRLSHWPASSYQELCRLLEFIDDTGAGLLALCQQSKAGKKIALSNFIGGLHSSLEKLGVVRAYSSDSAGQTLLALFDQLDAGVSYANPELSWRDCRLWLGMALESQNFKPPTSQSIVKLMTLDQARQQRFDSLVIAGCETQHFPGSPGTLPVFNQSVRTALGLQSWDQGYSQRLNDFINALSNADQVLITACQLEKGEQKPVSPWLEMMNRFYQLVYQRDPDDHTLRQRIALDTGDHDQPRPPEVPAHAVTDDLFPARLSASAVQRLVNCPYQFYAADALGLKPAEEISTELRKSDYGERIHRILQLFHCQKTGFKYPLDNEHRSQAEQYLKTLSEKAFIRDLEDNVIHRSWLYRWLKHIPAYIDWQIARKADWSVLLCEAQQEIAITGDETPVSLYGRLDRIDQHHDTTKHGIVDYKTGRFASSDDVLNGEDVQLATYALLDPEAQQVEYLSIDDADQKVKSGTIIEGDELDTVRQQNRDRLIKMLGMMRQGHPLTAWGDEHVCQYCRFNVCAANSTGPETTLAGQCLPVLWKIKPG